MSELTVRTNNVPRLLIDAYQLTAAERADFDYINWAAIEAGEDSATFFRFRGQLYDLGEFTTTYGITRGAGLPDHLAKWDGYMSESAFSAVVVRLCPDDNAYIVVGRIYS